MLNSALQNNFSPFAPGGEEDFGDIFSQDRNNPDYYNASKEIDDFFVEVETNKVTLNPRAKEFVSGAHRHSSNLEHMKAAFYSARNLSELNIIKQMYLEKNNTRDSSNRIISTHEDFPVYYIDILYKTVLRSFDEHTTLPQLTDSQLDARVRSFVASEVTSKRSKQKSIKISSDYRGYVPFKKTFNNYWKVPMIAKFRDVFIPKPTITSWSPLKGQAWIASVAWQQYQSFKPPNWAVVGNQAAQFLWQCVDQELHPKILGNVLDTASLWWQNMNHIPNEGPRKMTVGDFIEDDMLHELGMLGQMIETRSIVLGGVLIDDKDQLKLPNLQHFMHRNGPWRDALVAWLDGADEVFDKKGYLHPINIRDIEHKLNEKFVIEHKQGLRKVELYDIQYALEASSAYFAAYRANALACYRYVDDMTSMKIIIHEHHQGNVGTKETPFTQVIDRTVPFHSSYVDVVEEKDDSPHNAWCRCGGCFRYTNEFDIYRHTAQCGCQTCVKVNLDITSVDPASKWAHDTDLADLGVCKCSLCLEGVDQDSISIKDMLTSLITSIIDIDGSLKLVKFVTFTVALFDCNSWMGITGLCLSHLVDFPVFQSIVYQYFALEIKQSKKLKTKFQIPIEKVQIEQPGYISEAKSNVAENIMGDIWEAASSRYSEMDESSWNGLAVTAGIMVLSSFVDIPEFATAGVISILKKLGSAVQKLSIETLATKILKLISVLLRRIKACYKAGSIKPLFDGDLDPSYWMFEVTSILMYSADLVANDGVLQENKRIPLLVKEGKLPDYISECMSNIEYLRLIDELHVRGRKIKEIVQDDAMLARDVAINMTKLNLYMEMHSNSVNVMSTRVQPFGMFIYGPAGSGKTTLMNDIEKAIARSRSYPMGPESRYYWQVGVNFQDNLDSKKWLIICDDVDTNPAPATASVATHATIIQNLVNNAPMPVEKANLELKGKECARPLLVAALSNFEGGRLLGYTLYPPAFWRRLGMRVRVEGKPEFSQEGTLDTDKAFKQQDKEVQLIYVSFFTPSKVDKKNPFSIPFGPEKLYTRSAFLKLVIDKFNKHMKNQLNYMASSRALDVYCKFCMTDKNENGFACSCVENKQCGIRFHPRMIKYKNDLSQYWSRNQAAIKAKIMSLVPDKLMSAIEFGERLSNLYDKFTFPNAILTLSFVALCFKAYQTLSLYTTRKRNQSRLNNVTDKVPKSWQRPEQTQPLSIPFQGATFTLEDIHKQLKQSMVRVTNTNTDYHMFGLIVSENLILIPSHLAWERIDDSTSVLDEWQLEVVHNGVKSLTKVWGGSITTFGSQSSLTLVKCDHIFGVPTILTKVQVGVDYSIGMFDECYFMTLDKLVEAPQATYKTYFRELCLLTRAKTLDGDCGGVYIARSNKSWRIVAMHDAEMTIRMPLQGLHGDYSKGVVFNSTEIKQCTEVLAVRPQGISYPPEQFNMETEVEMYPRSSEVLTAEAHHDIYVYKVGTLKKPIHNTSAQTRVHPTVFAHDFSDLVEEWCGQKDYWQIPKFNGRMIEDKWISPYYHSLRFNKRVPVPDDYLWLALIDYIYPLQFLDNHGFRGLSEEESIVGIPGSVFHSVDRQTSTGPPLNSKKINHLYVKDDEIYMNKLIFDIKDSFKCDNNSDDIPAPLALGSLKDEPVKFSKNLKCDIRVFNCLPFGFNLHSKCIMGGVEAFMRANPFTFECMVGINMTSNECNRIPETLSKVDPTLKRVVEKDFEKQDKSSNGPMIGTAANVFYAISYIVGDLDPHRTRNVVLANKHSIKCYNNDLFLTPQNVSGSDITIKLASILNSITERGVYFRQKYPNGLPKHLKVLIISYIETFFFNPIPGSQFAPFVTFRTDICLVTFGDDSLATISKSCTFYKLDKIVDLGHEFGYNYTDGNKGNADIAFQSIDTVHFLKRRFVYNKELKEYLAPLNKKTLAKMLVLLKASTLTNLDHNATILTDVMREAVYHGEEFYSMILSRIIVVAEKYQLTNSPYFSLHSYDYYFGKIREGSFETWDVSNKEHLDVTSHVSKEHKQSGLFDPYKRDIKMSSTSSNVELGSADRNRDEPKTVAKTEEVSVGVAEFKAEAATITVGGKSLVRNTQMFAPTPLGDFLERATDLTSSALSTTDTQGTILFSFDPWSLFLSNAAIAAKFDHFAYIAATMKLTIVVSSPGGAFGLYCVSAVPNGGNPGATTNSVAATQPFATCAQTLHTFIDLSESPTAELSLPFIWPTDVAPLPAGPVNSWLINVWILTPISNGVSASAISGDIHVYGMLEDPMQLVVSRYQAKKGYNISKESLQEGREGINDKVRKMTGGKKASEVAKMGADFAGKVGMTVPFLAPFAGPIATGAAALGSVLDFFGFTRETAEATPTPVVTRPWSNVANMDAKDTSEIAALSVTNTISFDPLINGGMIDNTDIMSFAYLFSKWTLISYTNWPTTAVSQTNLFTIPVTPFYCLGTSTVGYSLTTAGYIGLPFAFWRGDMEYLFLIPVSKMHRGKLQVSWSPDIDGVTTNTTNVLKNKIIDVTAGIDRSFLVGYQKNLPCCESSIITGSFPTVVRTNTINGTLRCNVIQPLTGAIESASTTIYVFARAGANMQFGVPKVQEVCDNNSGVAEIGDFTTAYHLQASKGALGDEEHELEPMILVESSGEYDSKDILWGEDIKSVRSLMQKFSHVPYLTFNQPVNTGIYLSHFPIIPTSNNSTTSYPASFAGFYFNWAGWYKPLFTDIAGSIRWKFINLTNISVTTQFTPIMPTYAFNSMNTPSGFTIVPPIGLYPPTLAPMWPVRQGEAEEVAIPYYGQYKWQIARTIPNLVVGSLSDPSNKIDMITFYGDKGTGTGLNSTNSGTYYNAMGPDVRCSTFRFVPNVLHTLFAAQTAPVWPG